VRLPLSIAVALLVSVIAASMAFAGTDLVANDRGDQVLVHRVLGQLNRPLFAGLREPGGVFGPLRRVAPPASYSSPKVALDSSGGAVAAWTTFQHSRGTVAVATRSPGGGFGPARVLADHAGGELSLAVNTHGDAFVAWRDVDGNIEYSSRPAGGEFSPTAALPWKASTLAGVSLDDTGEALVVFNQDNGPGQPAPLVESLRPPGGDFSAPQSIQGVPAFTYMAFANSSAGGALLAWTQSGSIMAAERKPGGHFGAPFAVAAPASPIRDLALAPSGAAAVAFGYNDLAVTVREPGGSFTAPHALDDFGTGDTARQHSARVAVNNRGDLAVAWDSGDHLIRGAYRASGGSFGTPIVLAPARPFAPGGPDYPSVAIDGTGRATAAWEQTDGSMVKTVVRDFDSSGAAAAAVVDSLPTYRQEQPRRACTAEPLLRRSPSATVFWFNGNVYGCLFARGTWVMLNTDDEIPFPQSTMSLAGPFVGYAIDVAAHGVEESYIVVTDLRDEYFGLNRSTELETRDTGELAATRVRRNGGLAWISCPTPEVSLGTLDRGCARPGGWVKHVFAWDSHAAKRRLLDNGRTIDPHTLRLHGSLLTWRHGRKLHHARLR
jgi:hypothetical protein